MSYLDIFNLNKQIHTNSQKQTCKPQIQKTHNERIIESGIGSDEFFKILEKELPAIFCRQTASKAIDGLISAKTLSNLDSLGEGPVQINFAKSINVIVPQEISITRMAVTTVKDSEAQQGGNKTMGRKYIVPYALYRAEGYISAPLGEKTNFTEDDLQVLWEAIENMFEHDHSAARGKMAVRKLFVFKHESKLGNAKAHELFEKIQASKNADVTVARAYFDYTITIDKSMPSGVELLELV